ncbi:MAG: IS1634 family transposase [Bacteroidales bacterium]
MKSEHYFRVVESYRDVVGDVKQRSLLTIGFSEELTLDNIDFVSESLNALVKGEVLLHEQELHHRLASVYYNLLIQNNKIDRTGKKSDKERDIQSIDINSIKHKDIRELGTEWIVQQAIRELKIREFLESRNWSPEKISLAETHLIARTVYPCSEYKAVKYIQENSSACELTAYPTDKITRHKLYDICKELYKEKDGLEHHLSNKTNELFDLQDKIILYDLTNTYYEGDMRKSRLAKRGRSKEKRNDCPLIVLALVVNIEGFIKYSAIYRGNMSDASTMEDTINNLRTSTSSRDDAKCIVVLDAGIATEENLAMISKKGYDYVCVSRSKIKSYRINEQDDPVSVKDHRGREIRLQRVKSDKYDDYILKVNSPNKAMTEASMLHQFCERYEQGLQKISAGIQRKGGVKRFDKVCERIGRLKEKYPSVHYLYDIDVKQDGNGVCTQLLYTKNQSKAQAKNTEIGTYFLRTSIDEPKEELVWTVYNCIREIESTFRCLKTDLDLRPIYHKSDEASQAHLHLGLMSYWLVSTIRYKLKAEGIRYSWGEINRIMHTHKYVSTTMENYKGDIINIRKCSTPNEKVERIYKALDYKSAPFVRRKSVVHKSKLKKNQEASP